ncbi:hypothetical protein [Achromobacter xylosoxidans]|uniref:hypothetical protein n=1 Tax=Alcaligenes xylosoxydans xylosoxydans TaxID=85698 RepID=UPI001F140EE8|nr:hypothetical protein [Achromobacter xylosoxidans]
MNNQVQQQFGFRVEDAVETPYGWTAAYWITRPGGADHVRVDVPTVFPTSKEAEENALMRAEDHLADDYGGIRKIRVPPAQLMSFGPNGKR